MSPDFGASLYKLKNVSLLNSVKKKALQSSEAVVGFIILISRVGQ